MSGLRKGTGAASRCPVLWAALIQVGFGLGFGGNVGGLLLVVVAVDGRGWATFP